VGAVMADGGDLEVSESLTPHAAVNREAWAREAANYVAGAERNWASTEFRWGILDVPESELGLLGNVAGKDVVELGCGTAYVSAWLARLGARPVGVDLTAEQLATARAMQAKHGLEFPLVHASAEDVPLPEASFDLAISEYGASIWCDPYRWIPEAARVLRPGGQLSFLVNGTILMLCVEIDDSLPPSTAMLRDYFGMHRFEWLPELSVEFHLGYGDTIRLLRDNGFEVEDLIEIQAPEGATTRFEYVTSEWAHRWPSEEVWKVRKTG
jgi:ubiquinone/menaquinone biosynthesis C-methylase UbiE